MKTTLTLFLFIVFSLGASAQVIWDFSTASPTVGILVNSTVSNVSRGNNDGATTFLDATSSSTGYIGATGGNNAAATAVTGAINSGTSTYYEVTITPALGYQISIASLTFGSFSDVTGPQSLSIRTSLDAYATDAATVPVTTGSWGLRTPAIGVITGGIDVPVTLRIYGSGGTGTPTSGVANFRIDDLSIVYVVGVLAVNLSSFNGNLSGANQATLKWKSSAESNLASYTIERSTDGSAYTGIAVVNANGNSGGTYQYTDVNIARSLNFYRLKMNNNDGSFKYSSIVRINNKADNATTLSVYPSPATTTIKTEFFSAQPGEASLTIIDMTGKVHLQQSIRMHSNTNTISVPVENLSKGVYTVMIRSANGTDLKSRFIKN